MKTIAALGLLGLAVGVNFVRVNSTPSVPVGVYVVAFGQAHRGDFAEICPPDAIAAEGIDKGYIPTPGPCYHFSAWLIKKVAAVGGDVVDVSKRGIAINGKLWPGSQRRYFAHDGTPITRWIPYGRTRLASDQVLALGTHPDSWDGRIWSFIQPSSIRARMLPLLTSKGY